MGSMFFNATNFTNQDLSGWDVSNVSIHDGFFVGAGSGNIEPIWNP
jgi:surface protein